MKRKWFIVVALIAIVAVVLTIVFINLFKDRDTEDLSKSVVEYVEDGYLNEEDEDYKVLIDYFGNMSTVLLANDQTIEQGHQAENYYKVYQAFVTLGEFINNELIYSKFTDVYKNNKKPIENSLKQAQDLAKTLAKDIVDARELTQASEYWTINTWKNFEADIESMMDKTTNAFVRLIDVYQSCVTSPLMNNDFTDVVFDRVSVLLEFAEANAMATGEFAEKLSDTIEYYLADNEPVLNFNYNSALQIIMKDIKEKGAESQYYIDFCNCKLNIEGA